MTDTELKEIGISRVDWDRMIEEEIRYVENWASKIDPSKL